jgi:hypothetical protein
MFIVLPVPVSLFWRVSKDVEEFLRITFALVPAVAPFSVSVPTVALELPIVRTLVLAAVTSICPIERADVPIFIPAVVAVPAFWNSATLPVSQAPEAVLGVQFAAVYHAVEAPVFPQTMLETVKVAL